MNFGRRFKPCECEVEISGISAGYAGRKNHQVRHETVGLTMQSKLSSRKSTSGAEAEFGIHERMIGVRTLEPEALLERV